MERTEAPLAYSTPDPVRVGSVAVQERQHALDAARGWALLGIFLVNVLLMGWPLSAFIGASGGGAGDWLGGIAVFLTGLFATGRSFPLFSLLFGIGLAIQMERSEGAFGGRQVRRLLMLALFGVAHALFLWYGDILFAYALCGFAMGWLFLRRSIRTLCVAAGIVYVLGVLLLIVMTLVSAMGASGTESRVDPSLLGEWPVKDLVQRMGAGEVTDPSDPFWIAAETKAFAEGPYSQAVAMRALLWAISLRTLFALGGTGLIATAMFLLGAALHRSRALSDPASPWPGRMLNIGVVALVVSAIVQIALIATSDPMVLTALHVVHTAIGPAVSAGYLGAVVLFMRRPAVYPRFRAGLCAIGRMALSNYLLQSLIGAAIFQHWGAALFGQWSLAAGTVLAVVVWLLQMEISRFWLAHFRFGPFEWFWRSVTYARLQPLRAERVSANV